MDKLIFNNKDFTYYEYTLEDEFEKDVVANANRIFGDKSIYFDIKKRIGDKILSIPDGYLLDFSFANEPRLYIIENELVIHDAYKHIGQQILRFAISYKASGRKIKNVLLEEIQAFVNDEDEEIFKFDPFHGDFKVQDTKVQLSVDELDTIVVPAREDGFNEVFLGEDCWYSIRMSSAMIDRVKYIAAYQTAPISSITHYAEVSSIERYENTNKYIVYFKDKAIKIKDIKLPKDKPNIAPQSCRYTNFNKMVKTNSLADIF